MARLASREDFLLQAAARASQVLDWDVSRTECGENWERREVSQVFIMRSSPNPSSPLRSTCGGAESSESGATLRLRCPEHGSGLSHESRAALGPGSRPCSLKLRPQCIIRLRSPPPHLLSFVPFGVVGRTAEMQSQRRFLA